MIYLSKKGTFSSSQSHWHSQQEYICFVYFPSTLIEEKILPQRVPPHRALINVPLETFYIYVIFKRVFINNKLPIRVVYLTGTQKRNMFFLVIVLAYW